MSSLQSGNNFPLWPVVLVAALYVYWAYFYNKKEKYEDAGETVGDFVFAIKDGLWPNEKVLAKAGVALTEVAASSKKAAFDEAAKDPRAVGVKVDASSGSHVQYKVELAGYLPPGVPDQLTQWMRAVVTTPHAQKNVALLVGPSGSMKGLLVELVAAELGLEPVSIGRLAADPTLIMRRHSRLVLTANAMDGFDGTSTDTVKQLARANPRLPFLVTACSELYGKVTELSRMMLVFRVGPPTATALIRFAERVLQGEGMPASHAERVVASCSHDFDQVANSVALNNSGCCAAAAAVQSLKDPRQDALSVVQEQLFGAKQQRRDVASTYHAFSGEGGLFTSLIAENYMDATECIQAAAAAAEDISLGDVMETALYATQGWSLLDAWVCQAAVLPCCKARTHSRPTLVPRFSKLWSLFSKTAQRGGRLAQVRNAVAATGTGVFHADSMDMGLAIASMVWSLLERCMPERLALLLADLGVGSDLAHHLARMAGKTQYKAAHRKGTKLPATALSVYDGDTCTLAVEYEGQCWKHVCRLLGINSPEIKAPAGAAGGGTRAKALQAKQALANLLRPDCDPSRMDCTHTCKAVCIDPACTGSECLILVEFMGTDKYGRNLANLYHENGMCINQLLLSSFPLLFQPYLV
ncbi:hypothetical protein OEZ85_011001 [Tetradesmus obliquus]|uniref:AAA+ ATPase domain-containing protein n=1 Tax=Tetradesmus obliquus TaxID=3088 RepID=A0ABY8TPD4_TETOB|nr:hypothetical protein OEZ85_011001 [Tetradesmus obliquus]